MFLFQNSLGEEFKFGAAMISTKISRGIQFCQSPLRIFVLVAIVAVLSVPGIRETFAILYDFYRPPPMIHASSTGDFTTVLTLLSNGADPNDQDDRGRTALMWAADRGNADVVRALLTKGANANVMDSKGRTPLTWAKFSRNPEVISIIQEAMKVPTRFTER